MRPLVLALLGALLATPASAAEGLRAGAERRIAASERSLRRRWDAIGAETPHLVRKLNGKGADPHELITGGQRFIVRRPSNLENALRRTLGLRRLAGLFGAPELMPAAIKGTTPFAIGDIPAGTEVMVVERLPRKYRDGTSRRAWTWFSEVPEDRRLLGAVLDLLAEFGDRTTRNLMLDRHGRLRLVDGDSAYGAWGNRAEVHASAFFPGLPLGYETPQAAFEELPAPMRAVIDRLADSLDVDVSKTLRVDRGEALLPIHYARRIRRLGLSGAIDEYLGSVKLAAPR